jgi:hypothetical protein
MLMQDWYERRGYEVFLTQEKANKWEFEGTFLEIDIVIMRKRLH